MGEKRKLQKRVFVTEDDMSTLLQRYSAMTVLKVLQEVAQVQESKIDWAELVKKTTTGITNAREYQMLWRHLAYRHGLLDKLDESAQPMDDDSDLENELEAFPPVNGEASVEATAFVKVLIASGVPCDSNMPNENTVEAPLTITIPNGHTSRTSSDNPLHGTPIYGTKVTVPVTVQIQPLPAVTTAEGLGTNGPASTNNKRKRKPWSEAEDMELIAAVQKCGEGNWANLLMRGDFKGDRTPMQLAQRWATIRKRNNTVGNGSQLSEAQLAARHAMSMALGDRFRAACPSSTNGPNPGGAPSKSPHFAASNAYSGPKFEHQQDLVPPKSRVIPKIPSTKPATIPDSMVKAAAVAAGARISAPSGATSALKAAQSKKVVHIMPGGTPAVKSAVPGSTSGLPSNVHFIRTGLLSRPAGPSTASPSGTQQLHGHSLRPASPAIQPNPAAVASRTGLVPRPAGPSTASPSGTQQLRGHSLRPASPAVQPNPAAVASRTGLVPRPAGPSTASPSGTQQLRGQSLRPASPAVQPNPASVASRTGLVSRPVGPSTASTQQLQGNSLSPVSPAVQPNPAAVSRRTNALSAVRGAPTPSPAAVRQVKPKAATIQENQTAVLSNAQNGKVEVNRAVSTGNAPQQQVQKDRTFGPGNLLAGKVEGQTSTLGDTVKEHGGDSKASKVQVQEKLILGLEAASNNNIKTDLAVENSSVQGPAAET